MDEIIEEQINTYKDLTITVEYFKIKMYKIFVKKIGKARGYVFLYKYNDKLTLSANIEQIKFYINHTMKGE